MSVTRQQLAVLWHKAKDAGLTRDSLGCMLTLLNLDVRKLSEQAFTTLMPDVNAINAKKFSY